MASGVAGGPVVVLMPGVPFSNTAAEWRIPVLQRAFERLGARTRFLQYDGRGSGQSQRDVDDLSLDACSVTWTRCWTPSASAGSCSSASTTP